jgi:hypothetical protein
MRFLLPALIATVAAPAPAQFVGKPAYEPVGIASPLITDGRLPGPGIGRELGDLHDRIDRAREAGTLTRREARAFRREANQIGRLAGRYGRNGLSLAEHQELQTRALALRGLVSRPSKGGGRAKR